MIRRFQCIAGGFTSGMILAIEQNSIFFGTELRPYALIILLSTIGLACSLVLLGKSRATGVVNPWFFMLGSIFLGLAIQPTSIGTLICFPLFACSDQILRGEFKLKIPLLRPWTLALSVLTIIGAIAALASTNLARFVEIQRIMECFWQVRNTLANLADVELESTTVVTAGNFNNCFIHLWLSFIQKSIGTYCSLQSDALSSAFSSPVFIGFFPIHLLRHFGIAGI